MHYKVLLLVLLFAACAFSQIIEKELPLPDITVTFMERFPRYEKQVYSFESRKDTLWGKVNPYLTPEEKNKKCFPSKGEKVVFSAHVRNCGLRAVNRFQYYWSVDGKIVKKGEAGRLIPGEELVISYEWRWKAGNHNIAFSADPDNQIPEISEKNNILLESSTALPLKLMVEKSLYDNYRSIKNSFGSYSWEDWAQNQINAINRVLRNSIHPLTPEGILLRFKIDQLSIVPDGSELPDSSNIYFDGFYLFTKKRHEQIFYRLNLSSITFDTDLLRNIISQIVMPDLRLLSITRHENNITNQEYRSDYRDNFMNPNQDYSCNNANDFCEYSAKLFNSVKESGRGILLESIYSIPLENKIRLHDESDKPCGGIKVEVYRLEILKSGLKRFSEKPIAVGITDKKGLLALPKSPFGEINADGSNGLLLLVLENKKQRYSAWLELPNFNMQYWKGNKEKAIYNILFGELK